MNVLKESGTYLQENAKSNKNRAIIFFLIGGLGLLFSFLLEAFGMIYIFAISLGLAAFFFKNYINYTSGDEGEIIVAQHLKNLDNQYFLINDVKLLNGYGNIDHIVLGPNGIFVIETKNFEGEIKCEGDSWYQYKPEWKIPEEHEIKSPSKQVKGNALRLKQFIESKNLFNSSLKLWVGGIVVFSNSNVELNINNPTVTVVRIDNLCSYIKSAQFKFKFSPSELESIGKAILDAS